MTRFPPPLFAEERGTLDSIQNPMIQAYLQLVQTHKTTMYKKSAGSANGAPPLSFFCCSLQGPPLHYCDQSQLEHLFHSAGDVMSFCSKISLASNRDQLHLPLHGRAAFSFTPGRCSTITSVIVAVAAEARHYRQCETVKFLHQ